MNSEKSAKHCMICSSRLEYLEQAVSASCTLCGKIESAHVRCSQGHVVCNACHGKDSRAVIEETVYATKMTDPVALAELMMAAPGLPMLGCEHAFIAAGALMASLRNSPYGGDRITNNEVREVFDRTARQAIGGYCGLTGVCGIVPALGACFAVFLGSRCGSDREQKITMEVVTRISQALAGLTGPSCCKAYVRAGLEIAVAEFNERFGISLPVANTHITCKHDDQHPHGCREDKCPYFVRPTKDIFAEGKFVPGTVCTS